MNLHYLERRVYFFADRFLFIIIFQVLNIIFVRNINMRSTKIWWCLENFHLCFFINLLNILFPDTVECKWFFWATPKVWCTSNVIIRSEEVQSIVKSLKYSFVMNFLKLNICFFDLCEFNISLFVIRVEKVFQHRLRNNVSHSINNLFIVISVKSILGPIFKCYLRVFSLILC